MKQIQNESDKTVQADTSKRNPRDIAENIASEIRKNLTLQTDELHDIVNKQAVILKENAGKVVTWGIRKTQALTFYLVKLLFRLLVFGTVLGFYLFDRKELTRVIHQPFFHEITLLHLVWAFFMLIMIAHLVPNNRVFVAIPVISALPFRRGIETVYFIFIQIHLTGVVFVFLVIDPVRACITYHFLLY